MARIIAFHAPLKPPDHPIASGDREIARLLVQALEKAGYSVHLPSRFISYQKRPSPDVFAQRREAGIAEAARVSAELKALPAAERPSLWLTYHPYCKAPDWLGPAVAARLSIPYATVEACRTRQDTDADWAEGRAAVQAAIRGAALNFCIKPSDRAYLDCVLPTPGSVRTLAPFIDVAALPPLPERNDRDGPPVIAAVGMMRPGKKATCFLMLAEALKRIADRPWRLVVIGDGPERGRIEEAFAPIDPARIEWTGAIDHDAVVDRLDRADLFAWPGWREPIGMVFLEAAARGLPVVAFASLGVPAVVRDGETGILVPEGAIEAYGDAIAGLLGDPQRRRAMGEAGKRMVRQKHDIAAASAVLRDAIDGVIGTERQP